MVFLCKIIQMISMTAETLTVNLPPPSGRKGRRVTEPSRMAHWNDGVDLTMQNPSGWHRDFMGIPIWHGNEFS